jgi:hypothetical protein
MYSYGFSEAYPKTAARFGRYIFLFFIILFFASYIVSLITNEKPLEINLVSINGTLNKAEFRRGHKDSRPCASLTLLEYPENIFLYTSGGCDAFSISFFNQEIKYGDSISFAINKNELDRHFKRLNLFEVKSKYRSYLSKQSIEDDRKMENQLGKYFLVIAIVVLVLYLIYEFTGVFKKFESWYSRLQKKESQFEEPDQPKNYNELGP